MKIESCRIIIILFSLFNIGIINSQEINNRKIESWVTESDRSLMFEKTGSIEFHEKEEGSGLPIVIDDRQSYQTMDGFGFALTEGSAFHIHRMSESARKKILTEMFAADGKNVGFSYIRLTLGASDLNNFIYS